MSFRIIILAIENIEGMELYTGFYILSSSTLKLPSVHFETGQMLFLTFTTTVTQSIHIGLKYLFFLN